MGIGGVGKPLSPLPLISVAFDISDGGKLNLGVPAGRVPLQ